MLKVKLASISLGIGLLVSGCGIIDFDLPNKKNPYCEQLPQDIKDRFTEYKKQAQNNDALYAQILKKENYLYNSYWKPVSEDKTERFNTCRDHYKAYNEVFKENPNILKVNGIEKKLKAEQELHNKADNRYERKLDEAKNQKKSFFK